MYHNQIFIEIEELNWKRDREAYISQFEKKQNSIKKYFNVIH